MSTDPIVQGLDLSRQLLSTIDNYIKSQILSGFLDSIPGVDVIGRTIESELAKTDQAIYLAEKEIKDQIEPAIKNAVPNALAVAASLAKSVDDHLTQLLANIATTEDVVSGTIATLKKHAPSLAKWIYDEVEGGLGATILNVLKALEHQETSGIDALLDHILSLPNQPPYFKELTQGFRHRGAEWQALALPAILVGVLLGAVEAIQEPFTEAVRQGAWSNLRTKELDPADIITLRQRSILTDQHYEDRLSHHGFNTDVALYMLQARQQRLAPDIATRAYIRGDMPKAQWETELQDQGIDPARAEHIWYSSLSLLGEDYIRNAYLRGIFNEAQHDRALGALGYQSDTAKEMRGLYFFIPPVADLIHMGIRNVFNPQIVERFTLGGDYPQAFEDAARQQGVSKEWALKYWESHWIMPGRDAFFEMFQRTTDKPLDPHADEIELEDGTHVYNIMGRDTLNLALRDIDTPPFYRDKLTQVAYRPLTRIDIRRLHKVGLLSKAQVERAYLDLGNPPEHARLLAEFVVRLNATTSKNQAQTLTTNLQRHVVQLFIQDKLSKDEVTDTLTDLQFTPEEIDVFVQEANLVRAAEFQSAVEGGIGKLYMAGIIQETEAIQRLRDSDLPEDAIATLLAKWNLAIEYQGGTEHIHKHRELTKGEVLQALIDNIIDEPTAESMLEDLGYDKNGADAEIGLALYKAAIATQRVQIDAIKASFVNGVIEQLEASNRLDALSIPFERRDAYLAEWSLARETRTERIPIATLRDMLKGEYLTDQDTFFHLKRHRFTDDDANLLIRFWLAQPTKKGLASNV